MRRNTSGSIELTFKCHWWPPPPPQQDAWLGRDAPRTTLYTRLLSPPTPPQLSLSLSLLLETVEQVLIFHAFREMSSMEICLTATEKLEAMASRDCEIFFVEFVRFGERMREEGWKDERRRKKNCIFEEFWTRKVKLRRRNKNKRI